MTTAFLPQVIWDHDLVTIQESPADWLWHGLLAKGNVTLLTSLWKAGKTTLLALLLSRRKAGGQLGGLAVTSGKTLVVSEEAPALWAERHRRYDFGGQAGFLCRPFLRVPRPEEWQALLDHILVLLVQHGIDLVVFDPLAPYLRCESQSKSLLETLMPLGALTRRGLAVGLLHHPGKGSRPIGQAARGGGALLAHADIIVEMRHPGGDPFTRRRRFLSLSRHAQTPPRLLLELNPEETDYLPVPEEGDDPAAFSWEAFRMVLENAPQKLTRQDILAEWPEDFVKPDPATLWKWLKRALAENQIACEGTGRKGDPFRYWLPEREAVWKQHPLYEMLEQQRKQLKLPFESLQERKRLLAEDHEG
jgi:hypothetical protein